MNHDYTIRALGRLRQDATMAERVTMLILAAEDGGISMGAIAARAGVNKATLTSIAQRLVDHGWAKRSPDPTDRRIVRLEATVRCRKAVAKAENE